MLSLLFAGLIAWVLASLTIGGLMFVRTIPSKGFHENFRRIQLHAVPILIEQKFPAPLVLRTSAPKLSLCWRL